MFRSSAVRAISLVGIGMIVGFFCSRPARGADPPDSVPPPPPAAQSDAPPAVTPTPDGVPPSDSRLQMIPGLRELVQPDGSILLPGGAGIIRRDPNHIGIQFNTPDGPFEFVLPRRRRMQQNLDQPPAPGSDTDAPAFGSPSPPAGRSSDRNGIATPSRPGPSRPGQGPAAGETVQERRALHEYAVSARLFHARNYLAALRRVERGLAQEPGDQNLLQLRSLIFFTQGDYRAAYRDARTVMADDDIWDWPTLRSLYHPGEYTARYRALEEQVTANPNAAELWFLLAYHNRMLGNLEASKQQFQRVAALDPANDAARRLSTGQPPPSKAELPPTPLGADRLPSASRTQPPARRPSGSGPISVDLGQPAAPNSAGQKDSTPSGPVLGK